MVWAKLIIFSFLFIPSLFASELSDEEINYFKIADLNNDDYVSILEVNQSVKMIFQLIDLDKDNRISLDELKELKNILFFFK